MVKRIGKLKAQGIFRWLRLAALLLATAIAPIGLANASEGALTGVGAAPIDVSGCWTGALSNESQGNTSIEFVFDQKGSKIHRGSGVLVGECTDRCGSWVRIGETVNVIALISGAVNSSGFTFRGHFRVLVAVSSAAKAGRLGCTISGQGVLQDDGSIAGSYRYQGKCSEQGFVGGDFSISASPSCN